MRNRMVKSRRASRRGIFGTLYSVPHHGFSAVRGVAKSGVKGARRGVRAITSGADKVVGVGLDAAGNVVNTVVGTVDEVGMGVTNHANSAISNLFSGVGSTFSRKSRKGGRRKASRKGRKASRKASRKGSRKGRKASRKGSRKVRK
jgi:phage-related protein